ncbi:hypothetical protein ASD16_18180 [Cellulomonas sp. Root485]|nr:hypothetical protein ASD16_18180 [Cellulomonas sp. Root485]
MAAGVAVAAFLALHAMDTSVGSPVPAPTSSDAASCGGTIPCSPSGEVAARWSQEREAARLAREGRHPFESGQVSVVCGSGATPALRGDPDRQ